MNVRVIMKNRIGTHYACILHHVRELDYLLLQYFLCVSVNRIFCPFDARLHYDTGQKTNKSYIFSHSIASVRLAASRCSRLFAYYPTEGTNRNLRPGKCLFPPFALSTSSPLT